MVVKPVLAGRFLALFQARTTAHGCWDPASGKSWTVKDDAPDYKVPGVTQLTAHFAGELGLGLVPITDDGDSCWWGALDIDNHGPNATELAAPERVAELVEAHRLPVVVCRTKSGGSHCYVFFEQPVSARSLRELLTHWAAVLGCPTAEVFPKHHRVARGAVGNWINLPYFKVADTQRYAIIGGKRASLEYFIETAESLRLADVPSIGASAGDAQLLDFSEAPPCLVAVRDDPSRVNRNDTLFQAGIWLKRQHATGWKSYLSTFNERVFKQPLSPAEVEKVFGSVSKKDYLYGCDKEPCVSRCNRDLCITKKYGIKKNHDYYDPPIKAVLKICSDPPRYSVSIFDKQVTMDTQQWLEPGRFQSRVYEITGELIEVPAKRNKWHDFIRSIKDRITETDEGSGTQDVFLTNFRHIASDAQTSKQIPDESDRRRYACDTGPAIITIGNQDLLAFKFAHLEKRLKQQYSMYVLSSDLAALLRSVVGATSRDVKVAGRSERLWLVPVNELVMSMPEIKLDLKVDY